MTLPHDDAAPTEGAATLDSSMAIACTFNRREEASAKEVVFPADDPIKKLPDIEKAIQAIPRRPLQGRLLEDDFIPKPLLPGQPKHKRRWRVKDRSRFYQYRLHLETLMQLNDGRYNLSLYARAFNKHLGWCWMGSYSGRDLSLPELEARQVSQRFQTSLELLTEEITSPAFKRQVKESTILAKSRASSLRTWMRSAFQQAPYLLWVQVQLSYRTLHYADLAQSLKDRQAFLKNRRGNPLFNYLVGYVGKLHYFPMKGLVHDMIFLYDARYVQEGASLPQAFAQRWRNVTNNHGIAWIEGELLHPEAPRINGVCSLETEEDQQRLKQLIRYLSHYDTYLHYDLPPHTRTLVTSQRPGKKRATKGKKGQPKTPSKTRHKPAAKAPQEPSPFEI